MDDGTFDLTQINQPQKKQPSPSPKKLIEEPETSFEELPSPTKLNFISSIKQDSLLQQTKEDLQDKKERQWKNVIKKLAFPPTTKYQNYDDYPVKPGYYFYKALANAKKHPKNLQLNLPITMVPHDKNGPTILYTDQETGFLQRKKDCTLKDFDQLLRKYHKKITHKIGHMCNHKGPDRPFNEILTFQDLYYQLKKKHNPEVPFVIQKYTGEKDWEIGKNIVDFQNFKQRHQVYETTNVEQQFIFPSAMKAQSLRLCYYTKSYKGMKDSYGYQIVNHEHFFVPGRKNIGGNVRKYCTSSEHQDSFTINMVKGPGIKQYLDQCKNVVQYLEQNYPIRIENIVLDFMQDFLGNIFLIGCRYISLQNCPTMKQFLETKNDVNEDISEEQQLDQLTCSVFCKLCGIIFKKDDASKTLTFKLLHEFVQHLKKRNVYLNCVQNITLATTRQCRVCNLCYQLVVQEHELIEIEQKLAIQQKIPIYDPVFRVPTSNQVPKNRPALLENKLKQWRMMFNVTDIQDIFNNYEGDIDRLYLQYKISDFKTCWKLIPDDQPQQNTTKNNNFYASQTKMGKVKKLRSITEFSDINNTISSHHQKNNAFNLDLNLPPTITENNIKKLNYDRDIELKCLRLHYFFSTDNDLTSFLEDSELVFRITEGTNWNNMVAEGKSKTMSYFQNKHEEGQRHSCRIMLFFDSGKYCTLYLNSGLVCDQGKYDTSHMNLHKYNGIYFPDESHYNSNPLPDVWMELFDVGYIYRKEEIMENKDSFEPVCNKFELQQMLETEKNKKSKKYNNITSKFKDTRSISYTINPRTQKVESQILPKTLNRSYISNKANKSQHNFNNNQQQHHSFYNDENQNTSNLPPQQKQKQQYKKPPRMQSAKLRSISNNTNFTNNLNNTTTQHQNNKNNSSVNISQLLNNTLNQYNNNNQIKEKKEKKVVLGENYEDKEKLENLYLNDDLSLDLQNSNPDLKQKSKNKLKQIQQEQAQMDNYLQSWMQRYGPGSAQQSNRRAANRSATKSAVQWKNSFK